MNRLHTFALLAGCLFATLQMSAQIPFSNEPVYPNDPYFQNQRALHNTGQTVNGTSGTIDADIDLPEAWDITMGSPDIIVAVIDDGVSANHPDLPNSRQVRLPGSNFGYGNPDDPSPQGNDSHGNGCAGVIAATANNNEGVAGIAPNCKIMPIRIDNNTDTTRMWSAIRFAVNNGARIISCSWGYQNPNSIVLIRDAINYATSHGVLMVFAAGNTAWHSNSGSYLQNGYVVFPANYRHEGVICVGASDRNDHQADYSPSAAEIDIVAPSHRAYHTYIAGENMDMWTIDTPGNAGSNPHPAGDSNFTTGSMLPDSGSNSNYLAYNGRFGGTSYACPVVAGVAALLLSENPNLTPEQLISILKSTADKVGGYTYTGGRCNEMGYGRVNAYKALKSICTTTVYTQINHTVDATYKGCDIIIEDMAVSEGAKLTVRPRHSLSIPRDFNVYTEDGSSFEVR